MNKIAFAVALLMVASFIAYNYSINAEDLPSVVYVDDDFDASVEGWNITHFNSIQEAINAVAENGTIYVYEGVYYENIVINKTLQLIGKNKPKIEGKIIVEANGSAIKNFEIAGDFTQSAILLNASSCLIQGCTIYNFNYGIEIISDNNTITKCNFINNSYGIYSTGNSNQIYLNNFIENDVSACNSGVNIWYNETMQKGNYWSDFDSPAEGAYDNDSDGIVDTSYNIPCGTGVDNYPLINNIDLFIPSINISINGSMGNNGWFVSNVSVMINASDNETGIAYVNYSINGEWYQSSNASFNFTLGEGEYEIECYAVDGNGNAGRIEKIAVGIDVTPPSISYTLSPPSPNGNNGWYTSNVEISLYASDSTSGIDELNYKIDEAGWQDYAGFFSVNVEGNYTVYFRAIDIAGNEKILNISLKIDKTPPAISIVQPEGGFVKQEYEIIWNASDEVDDNLDGNTSIFYSPDNGTTWQEIATGINNTGSYIWNSYGFSDSAEALIKIVAEDDAGNVGVAISNQFILDNTPPHITIKQPVGEKAYGKDEYGNILIEIEWEAYDSIDDDLDGSIDILYYDDSAWYVLAENYVNSGRYTVNAKDWEDGDYKIKILAEDDAGNVGVAISANFTIDKQPPSIYISKPLTGYVYINLFGREILPPIPLPVSPYDVVVIGKITVEVATADAHSGVQRIEMEADGNVYPIYSPPYKWEWNPSLGVHTLKATAYDNAGNSRSYEIEKVLCINV